MKNTNLHCAHWLEHLMKLVVSYLCENHVRKDIMQVFLFCWKNDYWLYTCWTWVALACIQQCAASAISRESMWAWSALGTLDCVIAFDLSIMENKIKWTIKLCYYAENVWNLIELANLRVTRTLIAGYTWFAWSSITNISFTQY